MKLYIEPRFDRPDTGEGGIRRVVEAQRKYLPEFGVELVDDIARADLTAGHGGSRPIKTGAPFISHSHGLYWSDYRWEKNEDNANPFVIEALLAADAITVPSEWVKRAYVRGLLRRPKVIYHGVELIQWEVAKEPGNYVLWNKPRHDAVSNANDLFRLVAQMPKTRFISTLGEVRPNLTIVGRVSYVQMKGIIQGAGVYLATARETFGIGTLEALASGVPVAGWRYGGQREIIREGETGYLADYGDYPALAEAVTRCFSERVRLSANARADAAKRWGWLDKIEQYAALYQCVWHERTEKRPKVSVIVTCHNLAKYLPQALDSVLAQTFRDWECVIVDDASTDPTAEVAQAYTAKDGRFKSLRSEENLKLSRARNFGFAETRGRYVINLDADDVFPPKALAILVDVLDKNPHLHIAYGSLEVLSEDGQSQRKNPFPGQFSWLEQMAHLNQLHYAALMRRSVWEEVGGYRERLWRAEDAEFWCRATSFGFRADKVSEETTLLWRARSDGKSAQERQKYPDIDGDWTADFPWAIAHTAQEGTQKKSNRQLALSHPETVPFGAPVLKPAIWHREHPLVTVIIPLGPGHERYVIDALDALIAQTFHDWEVIVIDDTGTSLKEIPGAPYVRLLSTGGKRGAGAARNLGLDAARTPLVLFLDADDLLASDALRLMVQAYAKNQAAYIYSGWRVIRPDGELLEFEATAYDREAWLLGKTNGRHVVSVLMGTEEARRIRFDENMLGYEDWDFFNHCAVEGLCGAPIPDKLVTYRHKAGQRSVHAAPHHSELIQLLRARYADYINGSKKMPGCCGGNKAALAAIEAARGRGPTEMQAGQGKLPRDPAVVQNLEVIPDGYVKMRFIGDRRGPVVYYANGHPYTGANSDEHRFVLALHADVQRLEQMGIWVRARVAPPAAVVVPPPPPALPPAPAPVIPEPKITVEVVHVVQSEIPPQPSESQTPEPAPSTTYPLQKATRRKGKGRRS